MDQRTNIVRFPLALVIFPKLLDVKLRLPCEKNGWFSQLDASAYKRKFTRSVIRMVFCRERARLIPVLPV
jgi:hypothetical protein